MASAENPSVSCSQDDEADSTEQLSLSETNKDNSGPPNSTDESNVMTTSGSSYASSKCDSNQDLEGTEKSIDGSRISGKTKKERLKIKVVPSRYEASAAAARNNTQGSNSSGSKSWSNETVNAGPSSVSKRQLQRAKPIRAKPLEVSKTKPGIAPGQSTSTAARYPGPQRSTSVLASKPRPVKLVSKSSKSAVAGSKAILHSTALNTTLMTDVLNGRNNNSMLSSTLVGGITPGGFKHNTAKAALLELPDLSVIKPEENNSGNRTVLSSVSEEAPQNDCDANTLLEVTPEMLEQEYMKYLHWAYVDVSSEKAFATQLREMQNQTIFLEQLVGEKQEDVFELKQKTDILVHHQRVSEAFDKQMKLLLALGANLPACEEAEKVMERELEKKLHQVKMENIYAPQDHIKYRDELSEALTAQVPLLQELEKLMEPQTQQRNSTIKLLADLQTITERVQRCEKEMQQAAGMAVEEASHQLGTKQMTLSAELYKQGSV